jgi:hypothetical protein
VRHTKPIDPSEIAYSDGYRWKFVTEYVPTFALRSAVLLHSERTPAGPRHRHVCYLGSIREGFEHDPVHGADFWGAVKRRLRKARIEGEDLARVVAKLEETVPRPCRHLSPAVGEAGVLGPPLERRRGSKPMPGYS